MRAALGRFICQYMHTIHFGAHILLNQKRTLHTNIDALSQMKIPALRGRVRTNNMLIFETLAIEGPLLKYDVYKTLKKRGIPQYSTITRRIDSLREKGYLDEADKRITERGKRKAESMYGITRKGFIASLVSKKVRENVLQVIEKNPLLVIPEKEFVLLVVREILDPKEIEIITNYLLYGYLKAIPDLENIEEEELGTWVFQAIREIPSKEINITEISETKKDLTRLLDNPRILQYVKERILPIISDYERNFYDLFQFFKILNQIGEYIKRLRPEDKPSDRLKEYLRTLELEEKMFQLEKEETTISKKTIKTAPKKEPSFLELIYGTEEK